MSAEAIKLTTYFEERDRAGGRFLADALFDLYEDHAMRTSVLLRGVVGFGRRHDLHTDRLLTPSETLPAMSIAVDAPERIRAALPEVAKLAGHGMITMERARLDAVPAGAENEMLGLTVYGGRGLRAGGQAGYVAALEVLRRAGVASASVLLAVDGTLHGERRRARFFARNARVPLMLLAIGRGHDLAPVLPALAALLEEPVVTVERVQVCKSQGTFVGAPAPLEARDRSGLPLWQQVTIHTEEQAHVGGHPLYLELVRRLAAAGAAGATVLRGVRGFHAQGPTLADRVLSLRRNVPVHVTVVDSPPAVKRWWPVVDELTRDNGVVTCEVVPAAAARGATDLLLARTPAHP